MVWIVNYSESAERELSKLDRPVARRILDYMEERVATQENPRILGKALTGQFGSLWRYRVGDWRVICEVQDAVLCVLVVKIGSRGDVYRE